MCPDESPLWFTATYHDPVVSGCCSPALQKGTGCRQYPSSRRFHWHRRRNTSVGLHLPSLFLQSCSLIGFFPTGDFSEHVNMTSLSRRPCLQPVNIGGGPSKTSGLISYIERSTHSMYVSESFFHDFLISP